MPEFTVKEVRMPELHLPEIKRDEIVRALSGIHIPNVDLTSADRRPRLPVFDLTALPWRKGGLAGVDAGKFVAAAIAAARVVRPAEPRSRWSPLRRTRRNLVAVVRPAPRRSRRRFTVIAIVVAVAVAWAGCCSGMRRSDRASITSPRTPGSGSTPCELTHWTTSIPIPMPASR